MLPLSHTAVLCALANVSVASYAMSATDGALIREVKKLRELKQTLAAGLDQVRENGSKILQSSRRKHDDVQSSVQSLELRMSKAISQSNELERAKTTIMHQRADIESQIRVLDLGIDAISLRARNSQTSLKALLGELRDSQNEYQMLVNRHNRLLECRRSMIESEDT